MTDLVVDTHVFVDILSQYYSNKIYARGLFKSGGFLTDRATRKINEIVYHYYNEDSLSNGIVCTSIMSYVEIVRKFQSISKDKFSLSQFKSFIENKPTWLTIAPLTQEVYHHLFSVPKDVRIGQEVKSIEWSDAIHCATYLTRENALFATFDGSIKAIENFKFI